ncbi:hypothetical protein NC653_018033 [Populus alba x Populus x berolinensis]|uniref:Uncharacterized protein n=1 Tax=Populus alba x Populus x berolinensis TaxID=444605 RepID=A0AAD6QS37_9ROSI|nr:hypothetical protein NC653_018033 [Populus alba x Populus x berolinensis]
MVSRKDQHYNRNLESIRNGGTVQLIRWSSRQRGLFQGFTFFSKVFINCQHQPPLHLIVFPVSTDISGVACSDFLQRDINPLQLGSYAFEWLFWCWIRVYLAQRVDASMPLLLVEQFLRSLPGKGGYPSPLEDPDGLTVPKSGNQTFFLLDGLPTDCTEEKSHFVPFNWLQRNQELFYRRRPGKVEIGLLSCALWNSLMQIVLLLPWKLFKLWFALSLIDFFTREEKPALFELELTKGSLDMSALNQCVLDSIFFATIKAARSCEI